MHRSFGVFMQNYVPAWMTPESTASSAITSLSDVTDPQAQTDDSGGLPLPWIIAIIIASMIILGACCFILGIGKRRKRRREQRRDTAADVDSMYSMRSRNSTVDSDMSVFDPGLDDDYYPGHHGPRRYSRDGYRESYVWLFSYLGTSMCDWQNKHIFKVLRVPAFADATMSIQCS